MTRRLCLIVLGLLAIGFAGCASPQTPAKPDAANDKPPVNPKEDARPLWNTARGEFIRDWLLCGSFPYDPKDDGKPALSRDYLADKGGEASIHPVEGMEHARADGVRVKWARINSGGSTLILRSFLDPPHDHMVAYAYAAVEWPVDGPAVLSVGSDDDVRVWVNGQLAHETIADRRSRNDQDMVGITLKKGTNHLLFKVANRVEKWGLVARVLDAQALARKWLDVDVQLAGKTLSVTTDHPWYASQSMGEVRVEALAAGGKPHGQASAKRGEKAAFDISTWPQGAYELRCTTADLPIPIYVPWYNGDSLAAVQEVVEQAPKLDMQTRKGMVAQVIADLVKDRLKGNLKNPPADALKSIYGTLLEWEELMAGSDNRPGGFVRMAWRDPIDDSPQFCRAYLPQNYDPAKKWPTIVFLHGYNPANPLYINWWSVDMRHHGGVDRYGFVLLEVHGRGNTGYSGIGELDVLRALAEAKKTFSIDEDRVYLTGESMGGGGTWHVGTRHPDIFAAIAPTYGGWDYRADMKAEDYAKLTPEQRFDKERWSSFRQAESLLTTPVFINHGDADDMVSVDFSRYAVRMLQRWGYDVRYWEHPGLGHTNMGQYDTVYPWLLSHTRVYPTKVRVRSYELKSAAAHWLRLTQTADPRAFMQAEAEITGPNTIRLETQNVLEAQLLPKHELIDPSKPVRIVWNAQAREVKLVEGTATVRADGYTPPKLPKTPALAGPVEDITTTPFAIVEGTVSKDPLMRMMCHYRAQRQVQSWIAWQKVTPRFFADTQISEEQIKQYSLILIGGPEDNLITRKLAGQLPLKISAQDITIDGKTFAARDAGMQMIYPHPLAKERYVLVIAGNSPAGMFHATRMPDDADFVITDGRAAGDEEREHDAFVTIGHFDKGWRYSEPLAHAGAGREKMPIRKVPAYASAGDVTGNRLMLSDVLEKRSEGSFEGMERDINWRGSPIVLGGKTYASGLGVQCWRANHNADWDLGGAWKTLRATVGVQIDTKLDQAKRDAVRLQFVVKGDGKELFRSPSITAASEPLEMQADVTGVKTLTLEVVHQGRPAMEVESVNWADLRVER